MNLLLDTHTFLWFIAGDSSLSETAKLSIEDEENHSFVSSASIWEITIKASLGRLEVPLPPSTLVREHVRGNNFEFLNLSPTHFDTLYSLPSHHKDPFDRLIISQAISENMELVTIDHQFGPYDVITRW